jgi:6-phosphofructokinase 1
MIKRIGVLTSGGDAPGMNAAIRAVTRTALEHGVAVTGIRGGYAGLMSGDYINLDARAVGGIIQQGGTILGSARSERFKSPEGQQEAVDKLRAAGIDAVVVIGGNGSQQGTNAMHNLGFPSNGVASTIDNDLVGSDITLGVDTALNIALESIDRLRVTASSHRRAFLVEVMGRKSGYLALMAGIAGGAEAVVIPEHEITPEQLRDMIHSAHQSGKTHAIVVVAEGAINEADSLMNWFKSQDKVGFEMRAITLGHVQRGGAPTAYDRILGSRLGSEAVEALMRGESGVLIGMISGKTTATPLSDIAGKVKSLDPKLYKLVNVLSH